MNPIRKLTIRHRESGKTLRQYAKDHRLDHLVPTGKGGVVLEQGSFRDEKLHYVISEQGTPGFYYHIPREGTAIYWLPASDWDVEIKLREEPIDGK